MAESLQRCASRLTAWRAILFCVLTMLFCPVLIGCGADSDYPRSYIATITTNEDETTLDLYQTMESQSEVTYLESFHLDYGGMSFLIDQGSVPDSQMDVPAECKGSTTLGEDKVGLCVFSPLLQTMSAAYALTPKNTIAVTAVFSKDENALFEKDISSLSESLDTHLDGEGYDAQIRYDPEEAAEESISLSVAGHYHAAYWRESAAGAYYRDWIGNLYGGLTLRELSIPGTHDSMSFYGGDIVQTQSMSLSEQLNAGIRALDIRCRHINNGFAIHHGSVYQKANFDNVLLGVQSFLASHPREFVVMRVKEEYDPSGNTRSFGDTFKTYYDRNGSLFWQPGSLADTNPTIDRLRGKILVFQDWDESRLFGINWNRNSSYSMELQDDWEISTKPQPFYDKWNDKVKYNLDKAFNNPPGGSGSVSQKTFVNFLSASSYLHGVLGFPYFFASGKSSHGTTDPLRLTGWTTPGWKNKVPDFPRVSCTKVKPQVCSIAYLGMNILASNKMENTSGKTRVGIIYADFPGAVLIWNVIIRNP
jgi:1-phosphatidylinositol phosphodiesterase